MFAEVDSAGCWVESNFTKKHRQEIGERLVVPRGPSYKALPALARRQQFASPEKDAVIKRMQSRTTQAIDKSHFHNWDFILYFDESFGKVLRTLRVAAQQSVPRSVSPTAKLVHLTGIEWNSCVTMQYTIDAVQKSLRIWLRKEIGWVPLPSETRVGSGPWRTKELMIPEGAFRTIFGVDGSESEKVEVRTGCKIKFVGSHLLRHHRLVSIIGPEDSLSLLPERYEGLASFPKRI